jgi:hypothetical protein
MRGFAAKVLLVALSSVCALSATELILRVTYPQQLGVWYNLRSGLVIHPPGTKIYLANFGQTVQFNSLGMRDVEHGQPKRPNTFRILVLGDSFIEALQVPLEASFHRRLEDRLRTQSGRRIDVMSSAVSGWGTDHQLEYLKRYGGALSPDLVLVAMTLHNDVSDNLQERFHALVEDRVVPRPRVDLPAGDFRMLKFKEYLASRSHLVQLVRRSRELRGMREAGRQLDMHVYHLLRKEEPESITRGWNLTRGLVRGIRDESARIGARTTVLLIPLSLQIYGDTLQAWLAAHGVSADELRIERPQEHMHEIGLASDVDTIDLLPAFRASFAERGRRLHLERDGHWNPEGHRLAAEVVAAELIGRRLLSTPPAGR